MNIHQGKESAGLILNQKFITVCLKEHGCLLG